MKVTIEVEFPDWFEIAVKQWLAANIRADCPPIAIEAPPPPVVFLQEALKEVFPAPAEPTEDEKLSAHGRMMFEKGATICDKCEKKKAPNHFELNSTICKTCEGKKLNPNGFPECRNCKKRKPGRWIQQISRDVWECKKPCTAPISFPGIAVSPASSLAEPFIIESVEMKRLPPARKEPLPAAAQNYWPYLKLLDLFSLQPFTFVVAQTTLGYSIETVAKWMSDLVDWNLCEVKIDENKAAWYKLKPFVEPMMKPKGEQT